MRIRLDLALIKLHPELSRRRARDVIEKGQVSVEGRTVLESGRLVAPTTAIAWDPNRKARSRVRASIRLLHEDDDVLVVDKPAGLLAVPTAPDAKGEDTALARVQEYVARRRPRRPYVGVVHRLDRDTSGALAFALIPARARRPARPLPRAPDGAPLRRLVDGVPPADEGRVGRSHLRRLRGGPAASGPRRASPRTTRARTGASSSASPRARCSRSSWRRDASTRSACTSPTWACPSWATPSTARAARRTVHRRPRQMLHARHLAFVHPRRANGWRRRARCPRTSARPSPRCAAAPARAPATASRTPSPPGRPAAVAAELAQLGKDAVLDPVPVPPLARVHLLAVEDHGEVQVVARGQARGIALRDHLAARDRVAGLDREAGQVAVDGEQAVAVVDDDRVAVDAEVVGQHDHAVVGRRDGRVGRWWPGRSRGGPAGPPPCPCRRRSGGRRSWPRPASCRAGGRGRDQRRRGCERWPPSPPASCCWPRAGRG